MSTAERQNIALYFFFNFRIIKDSPLLAMAIAAEHLIQVFHTHGDKLDQSEMAQKGDS